MKKQNQPGSRAVRQKTSREDTARRDKKFRIIFMIGLAICLVSLALLILTGEL
jgi:predicted nucleic acid-binding Zn ribbon protein